jgi:DNA-binding transcriptional LysR family regulator
MALRPTKDALEGLGVLRAVIEAGSFSGGAEALGLTQPAVSRSVARLEARLGVRLFHRSARSTSLTDEGRRFHESVASHLLAIEEATNEAVGASAEIRGRLRINVDQGTAQYFLIPQLGPFLAAHPELLVEITARDRPGDLIKDGFDVAIRFGVPERSALTARLLMRARVVTCAAPSYLAQHGTPRKPQDLEKGHRAILFRDPSTGAPFGWQFVRGKTSVEVSIPGSLLVNDGSSMLAACLAGHGIAQHFEFQVRDCIADGRLVQILREWSDETFPLYAYHRSPTLMSARVRAFLDFLGSKPEATRRARKR